MASARRGAALRRTRNPLARGGRFGPGRRLIPARPGAATRQHGGAAPPQAGSAAALLCPASEWQVPAEELRYWVRAIPSPEQPIQHLKRNREGFLAELQP